MAAELFSGDGASLLLLLIPLCEICADDNDVVGIGGVGKELRELLLFALPLQFELPPPLPPLPAPPSSLPAPSIHANRRFFLSSLLNRVECEGNVKDADDEDEVWELLAIPGSLLLLTLLMLVLPLLLLLFVVITLPPSVKLELPPAPPPPRLPPAPVPEPLLPLLPLPPLGTLLEPVM